MTDDEKSLLGALYESQFRDGAGQLVLADWAAIQATSIAPATAAARLLCRKGLARRLKNYQRCGITPEGIAWVEEHGLTSQESIEHERSFRRYVEERWAKARAVAGPDSVLEIGAFLRRNRLDEARFERNYSLLDLPGPHLW